MKKNLLYIVTTVALLFLSSVSSSAKVNPTLGSTKNFVLFTSNGPISNVGASDLNGFIGTNGGGASTNFAITTGTHEIHDGDALSIQASIDLLVLYTQLNTATQTGVLLPTLGGGQELNPGVYTINEATTLTTTLILNGQGDPRSEFIFKIGGTFSTASSSQVVLINGANACNIYWKVEGMVSMATGTFMKGTVIANNAAIDLGSGVNLEGRALSTDGAITIYNTTAFIPDCSYLLTTVKENKISTLGSFSPNPMQGSVVVTLANASALNRSQLKIYNTLGKLMANQTITKATTIIETNFPTGIYYYKLIDKDNKVQSGKLISK